MSRRVIDRESYPRAAHFDYFRSLAYPYVGVTAEVDVSRLLDYSRAGKHSFYLLLIHAAALAADGVAELRQRIHRGQIVEYSECPTSHIELLEDGSYTYCTLRHHMGLEEYLSSAAAARQACRARAGIEEDADVESMYFVSALPWVHYTSILQPVAGGDESNPRITWGKYQRRPDGAVMLPVSLLAHHALVDGVHIARFYENLNRQIEAFGAPPPASRIDTQGRNTDAR